MIRIVLRQQLDHASKPVPVKREIGHVLVDFRAPGANGVLKIVVAVFQPFVPVLTIEQNGGAIDRVTDKCGGVHGHSPFAGAAPPRATGSARAVPGCRSLKTPRAGSAPVEFAITPRRPTSAPCRAGRDYSAAGSSSDPTPDSSAACRSRHGWSDFRDGREGCGVAPNLAAWLYPGPARRPDPHASCA